MQRKRKAIVSECAIFSYAYWLTTMNYVQARIGEYAPFQNRTVTVFDECHALMDCVQSMFMISLNMMRIQYHLDKLQDSLLYCVSSEEADIVNRALEQKNWLFDNVECIFEKDIALAEMLARVEHWNLTLKDYCMLCNTCKSSNDKRNVEKKQLARHLEYFETLSDTISYFISNAKGFEEWIAHRIKYEGENRILEIQTLKEDVLYEKHVSPFTGFTLLMSATIGDIETFANNLGLKKYDFAYMPSSFKFKNCPIYKTSPMYNMSMKYKDQNMGFLLKRIVDICDILHPNERGIIHTGNFEIARKLKEYVNKNSKMSNRYWFYDNSEDKELILANHKHHNNSIVIGPSLTEGIDLKDDLARFQILAKVPYPALDDFNKVHMKLVPNWYHWTTLVTFLQSIGRSIRHADDYATTYLLDAGFNYFLKNATLQPYIANRIELLKIEPLLYPNADEDLFDFQLLKYISYIKSQYEQILDKASKESFGKSAETTKPKISEEDYKILVEYRLTTPREFITAAALKLNDKIIKSDYNETHTSICIRMNLSYYQPGMIKGFIVRDQLTKAEQFVERKEANHVVYLAGQILGDYGTLYSCSYKYLSND